MKWIEIKEEWGLKRRIIEVNERIIYMLRRKRGNKRDFKRKFKGLLKRLKLLREND